MPCKKQTSPSISTKSVRPTNIPKGGQSKDQAKPKRKKHQLIDLLAGEKPVMVEMLSKALDWQPHTVRGAITKLRKAGFAIDSAKPSDGGGTCYRIFDQVQLAVASA
jgi:biotin operon repressor